MLELICTLGLREPAVCISPERHVQFIILLAWNWPGWVYLCHKLANVIHPCPSLQSCLLNFYQHTTEYIGNFLKYLNYFIFFLIHWIRKITRNFFNLLRWVNSNSFLQLSPAPCLKFSSIFITLKITHCYQMRLCILFKNTSTFFYPHKNVISF